MTQQFKLKFRSHKSAWRAYQTIQLLRDVGIFPRSLGFKWSTQTPCTVTLFTGDEP